MPRPRKDYRIARAPEPLIGEPGALTVAFLDAGGRLEQRLDFSTFASRPAMAAELALAFRQHHADKTQATRAGAYRQLRVWFRFLDEHPESIPRLSAVETSTLQAFIAWLDRRPWAPASRHARWSSLKQLLAWTRRNRPDLVHPDLEIPFNAFPRKNASTPPRDTLSRAEMEAVLAAARADIEASWTLFEEGHRALSAVDRAAVAKADLGRLDLDDLGVLLAIMTDRFGGVVPTRCAILEKGAGLWRLHRAIGRHGGARAVAAHLHATPETLIPYMIAIGAQTCANPEALRLFRRDCMSEHLLLAERVTVSWTKGRSNREQRRSFLRDKGLSVPNLIDRTLAMTAPLVAHAGSSERDRLFLVDSMMASRVVRLIPDYLVIKHVKLFVARHGLVDAAGAPLRLTLAALRPTGLTLAHEALGHDVFKTQALANHATPDTTQRYVARPLARKAQEAAVGTLQARFVDAVRTKGRQEPVGEAAPVDAHRATAAGFVCADPFSGVAEGQKAGRLCTAWLGCFTCPNAVIPLDPDVLARLMATRAALADARGHMALDRWRLLYAPKLEILVHDILPRFPPELHAAARDLRPPPPPPIE